MAMVDGDIPSRLEQIKDLFDLDFAKLDYRKVFCEFVKDDFLNRREFIAEIFSKYYSLPKEK